MWGEMQQRLQSLGQVHICDAAELLQIHVELVLCESRTVPESIIKTC